MSVYEEPGIKQAISGKDSHTNSKETLNNELISTVLTAWKPEHLYLRPKISNFYQVEKILIKHLHDFVMKDMESIDVSQSIYDDLIKLNKKNEGGPP